MSPTRIGPLAQAWYRWKALRLPWRKRFLVGFDLEGNTYWEFRLTSRGARAAPSPDPHAPSPPAPHDERWRRIVKYPRSTHYSDIRISPAWHSWLRNTRRDAPPLEEQAAEAARQVAVRRLAAEADRRWEAKPRVMEAPREEAAAGGRLAAPRAALGGGGTGGPRGGGDRGAAAAAAAATEAARETAEGIEKAGEKAEEKAEERAGEKAEEKEKENDEGQKDPWERARRGGAGEDWQPVAWNPGTTTPTTRGR